MAHGPRHATVAEEEYLQTIFWLQEAGLPMTGANVARAMQLSAPTVHEMIGRLERDGYITRGADKALALHRHGPRARRGHRPPPPPDRALPDRRPRASRGTRSTRRPSGSSTRCRRCSRSACWPRSATRRRARTATRSSPASGIDGVPLADVEEGAKVTHPALRERGRGPAALPQGRRASSPASRARSTEVDDEHVVGRRSAARRATLTRSVAETVSVHRRPVAAAAHRAARAARARQGPLRPLAR